MAGYPASHRGCVAGRRAVRPEWLSVRQPRCLPGDVGGPAGKNHRARSRPAAARLAGEADGKADESPLDPPLSKAAMTRYRHCINARSFVNYLTMMKDSMNQK